MAKKINKTLLNEELKRFRLLSEYSFYTEEPKKKDDDDLILGSNIEEADEDPAATDNAGDDSKTAANAEAETPAGDEAADTGTEEPTGDQTDDLSTQEPTDDAGADTSFEEVPTEEPAGDATSDEVEVDVTQLVKGSEEAKQSAADASQKTSELLAKFSELEQRVSAMDSITTKIEDLEKEIVKRNPTPVEKLEMRSMNSFPYNIKLTDYWKDIDGYDATGEEKPKEYVLTKDDIDGGFDPSINKTFDVPEDYDEEDISA